MEPTPDKPATYFPVGEHSNFAHRKPHQRARLVRITQVREEMTRVYNYLLRGFYAKYAQLGRDDPTKQAELYPEGFSLTAAQARACVLVLKEVAALVHTQAIEAQLDMLKKRIQDIIAKQGIEMPEFLDEDKPDEAEWAPEQIELMEKLNGK